MVGGEFRQPVLVGDVLGERAVAGVREGRLVHGFERREASLMLHLWGIAAERGRAVVSACMQGQGRAEALRVAERSIGPSRSNVNQWQSVAIDETHLCARGGLTGGLEVGSGLVQLRDFGLKFEAHLPN